MYAVALMGLPAVLAGLALIYLRFSSAFPRCIGFVSTTSTVRLRRMRRRRHALVRRIARVIVTVLIVNTLLVLIAAEVILLGCTFRFLMRIVVPLLETIWHHRLDVFNSVLLFIPIYLLSKSISMLITTVRKRTVSSRSSDGAHRDVSNIPVTIASTNGLRCPSTVPVSPQQNLLPAILATATVPPAPPRRELGAATASTATNERLSPVRHASHVVDTAPPPARVIPTPPLSRTPSIPPYAPPPYATSTSIRQRLRRLLPVRRDSSHGRPRSAYSPATMPEVVVPAANAIARPLSSVSSPRSRSVSILSLLSTTTTSSLPPEWTPSEPPPAYGMI
ncbi:hypothetical protein CALCODRAFT_495430 [Calocera cornea HHB12733]|uniref:Uncharacterized protein n=1 Tax=Calocera cornea HHB12733 TaxID=1353952 RepID=A0A165GED3_9BASI|nr:hypothetical protein CALCODRAFT_495430 [Calocera cornea HHB12733]